MSFKDAITIREAIENIDKKKYFLPAIQREFVWKTSQIEKLFDSLMRDYPISSFLFWEVEKDNIKNYQFYEFIRNYHERDCKHNIKEKFEEVTNDIIAILDGQQRLTSLYIGLKGTYAYKQPYKKWNDYSAFPKRKLCLNLISPPEDDDLKYDFQFLTDSEIKDNDDNHFWFVVGNILSFKEPGELNDYLEDNDLLSLPKTQRKFASATLFKLYKVILENQLINFFLEKDKSLDKVLNIFIRVNSGGTKLSYSDLLLSIAIAQWKEKDAKEEITNFVDQLNKIGDSFDVNKDFVLKSCLVISNFKEIAFKVDNFTQDNMLHIETEWENISKAIEASVLLVSSFGYNRETLTSNNALIPIALYLYKIGVPHNFSQSDKYKEDRKKIAKWLVIALLKGTFGGQPDNVLKPIRDTINNSTNGFPFDEIVDKLKGNNKAMSFNGDEIENLFDYQYKQARLFPVLAFIYPSLDFNNKFHQDHIFPKHQFTAKKLAALGIKSDEIKFYLANYNCLANLQLLEGIPNQEKSGKDFKIWLEEKYPIEIDKKAYMERHYIPDVDFSIGNFKQFIKKRKKLIITAFKNLL